MGDDKAGNFYLAVVGRMPVANRMNCLDTSLLNTRLGDKLAPDRKATYENYSEVISSIETIVENYNYDAATELEDLNKKYSEYEDYIESKVEDMEFDRSDNIEYYNPHEQDEKIDELFKSLYQ